MIRRSDSGSSSGTRSDKSSSNTSEKSDDGASPGTKQTGDSGSTLSATGNGKTNQKILRRNTDAMGHFIDSVRATGGNINHKGVVK